MAGKLMPFLHPLPSSQPATDRDSFQTVEILAKNDVKDDPS